MTITLLESLALTIFTTGDHQVLKKINILWLGKIDFTLADIKLHTFILPTEPSSGHRQLR